MTIHLALGFLDSQQREALKGGKLMAHLDNLDLGLIEHFSKRSLGLVAEWTVRLAENDDLSSVRVVRLILPNW
jgi:hypothetical protein